MRGLVAEMEACRQKIDEMLTSLLGEADPPALREAALHLVKAGGKRLRPFVALKACELVGGSEGEALPAASALELLHTFTLIHDDIMDRDERRRGVPTVHVRWGVPMAIDAGDLLFAMVHRAIIKHTPNSIPRERVLQVIDLITEAAIAICEGQALDLSLARREDVTEGEYLRMISLKTAALYEAAAASGAILGGGDESSVRRLQSFGKNLGLAFQIRDDILGIAGEEERTGKPVGSDLKEGKRTIVIVRALERGSEGQREAILKVLGNPSSMSREIAQAIEAIRGAGALDYAQMLATQFAEEAKVQLDAFPNVAAKRVLSELVDFAIAREF